MDSFTMLSRAINPLLLRTTSSQPRQHGIKAASTVKVDLGTDFLCEVCREIDLKKLLTRPHLNEQDFLRSRGGEPQDYLEAVFWDLRETRESTHCLLCQFLFLAMSIHKKPDLEKGQTIIVWPHPIAEYRCYPPFGFWDTILQWAGEKFRLPCYWRGTTKEPFTRIPKTIGWQLHIATESHSSQAGPNVIEAADEQADVTQVAQANQVTSNESKYRQIQKSYPNQLRDSTGYELHDSSERSKKLSYPTCARDIFHLRRGLDSIFACHPANAELSSICIQLQGRKSTGPLDVISPAYETANIMKCRGINADYANLALACQWQRFCSSSHSPFCEPLKWTGSVSSPFKLRVIDVSSECVVEAPPSCMYAALSYCWGGANTVCASREQEFTQAGVLSPKSLEKFSLRMPKTISDAIIVCKRLGIKFLWVDCLCIIQNGTDKKTQLGHMGYIYGGAQCTIVAGYGNDADAGLPGISNISRKRQHFHTQIGDLKLSTAPRNAAAVLRNSVWYTRGWTFQELILSKRLLVFTEEQMLFFCVRGAFREDLVLEPWNGSISDVQNLGSFLETHIRLTGRTFSLEETGVDRVHCRQAVQTFEEFLSLYLRRDFTYETDILDAFSGFLEALLPYIGPFRWGMPVYCSSHIFAWRSTDRFPLQRRVGFPSWSWAGWKGYTKQLYFGNFATDDNVFTHPLEPSFFHRKLQIFVFTNHGRLIPIEYATCLHESTTISGLEAIFEPPLIDPSITADLTEALTDHFIVFYANCVLLPVDRKPLGLTNDVYTVRIEGRICKISLDPAWRSEQADVLEFMLVEDFQGYVRLVLIIRNGPVAYRIQVAQEDVMGPFHQKRRKLIILG